MDASSIFIQKPNHHQQQPPFITSCISPAICFRRPEFRSRRRKCGLLGFGVRLRNESVRNRKRFVFRTSAALDPQTIVVVVSFVAVSALTVFYFNYTNNRKRDDESRKPAYLIAPSYGGTVQNLLRREKVPSNSSFR
nr:hypothetical protein [Tanacetum cinerariifolium]